LEKLKKKVYIEVTKSRRMRWAGHVENMARKKMWNFKWEKVKEKDSLGDVGV